MASLLDVDNWIIDQGERYAVPVGCILLLFMIFGLVLEAVRREQRKTRSDEES